jgi:hypothetical protein
MVSRGVNPAETADGVAATVPVRKRCEFLGGVDIVSCGMRPLASAAASIQQISKVTDLDQGRRKFQGSSLGIPRFSIVELSPFVAF